MSESNEPLWAPWRAPYVTGEAGRTEDGCVLCGIAADEDNDTANMVVLRRKDCLVVLNRYPYTNGHLMIVPVRHVPDFASLSRPELDTIGELLILSERALVDCMKAEGINGGWNLGRCAGAGIVDHLHLHVLPRWSGDTNFLTAVGETRVISQSLSESFELLAECFARLDSAEPARGD